jgi:beta-lactamase regulating signal transducer with metallopeptidase domain
MTDIIQLWSPALMRAVGFTLLHSLWQGALVAIVAGLFLIILHQRSARERYRLTAVALFVFVGLTMATFGHYYTASFYLPTHPSSIAPGIRSAEPAIHTASIQPGGELFGPVTTFLAVGYGLIDQHLPILVWAWALGMLGMSLRFIGGFLYIQRLRRYRMTPLPDWWQKRITRLAQRAGLWQPVQVLTSALVSSPMVIGYFKPVILLPLGAISGLSTTELEAILAHEIAHILRKDYLVNILQSIVELLFFYHPAVWFLSTILRTERENCCDDIATELCGDSLLLARALSSLAGWTYLTPGPRLAMAAIGTNGSLLGRVRRLARHHTAVPVWEGFWATCIVLFSAGLIVAGTTLSLGAVSKPLNSLSLDGRLRKATVASRSVSSSTGRQAMDWRLPTGSTNIPPLFQAEVNPQALFEAELVQDGLITNREHYSYTLTTRTFSVNSLPQSKATADKYRAFYEKATGKRLKESDSYQVTKNSQQTNASAPTVPKPSPLPSALTKPTVAPPLVAPTSARPSNQKIAQELEQDGLIVPGAKNFELILNSNGLKVNGKSQPASLTEKYRSLLHIPLDPGGQTTTDITIRVSE